MACPTPPPGHTPVNLSVWFDSGSYAAHLETQYGDLDLRGKGNNIPICITIDPSKNPDLKFYSDPRNGYGVRFAEVHDDSKVTIYNSNGHHQFHNTIGSNGSSIWFTYHNDETGGHDNDCDPYYTYSDIGFIVVDGAGVHESDPIIDNGSYTLRGHCSLRARHHRRP